MGIAAPTISNHSIAFDASVTISANIKKPEANGPFLVYEIPDMKGVEENTEHRAFYMITRIDPRFAELNDELNWYSANVVSDHHILFRFPGWDYPFWPGNSKTEALFAALVKQTPEAVQKSMNACHSVFDRESEAEAESRKWKYILLDFSRVKNPPELSSQLVNKDAGEKEILDYDYLEVDVDGALETFLGFKVGCVDPGMTRKVARSAIKKSKLAQKREAAKAGKGGTDATMGYG